MAFILNYPVFISKVALKVLRSTTLGGKFTQRYLDIARSLANLIKVVAQLALAAELLVMLLSIVIVKAGINPLAPDFVLLN